MKLAAALLLATLLTTGCTSFERAWRNAPAQPDRLAGRWEGQWRSNTGHKGKLRAVITPRTAARYDAHFHATYAAVFSADYAVALDVRTRAGRSEFQGAAELPLWGRYETTGHATPAHFKATYRSKLDRGTFEMQRPAN